VYLKQTMSIISIVTDSYQKPLNNLVTVLNSGIPILMIDSYSRPDDIPIEDLEN